MFTVVSAAKSAIIFFVQASVFVVEAFITVFSITEVPAYSFTCTALTSPAAVTRLLNVSSTFFILSAQPLTTIADLSTVSTFIFTFSSVTAVSAAALLLLKVVTVPILTEPFSVTFVSVTLPLPVMSPLKVTSSIATEPEDTL